MAGRMVLGSVAMNQTPSSDAVAPPSPEAMRGAMADYVRAVHQAYLDAARTLPPAEQARLPLIAAGDVTVLAVGARNLHVIATTEALPPPEGPEVELADALGPITWRLRFFDPVIVPALGLVDETAEAQPQLIREVLGVRTVAYHLSVPPGGGLTGHHALHAGTGLAHAHAAAHRDFDSIAALATGDTDLVAELRGAAVAGLVSAQLLLARAIAPASPVLASMDLRAADPEAVRRALLAHLRRGAA
jgi:hypothetical protein